MRSWWVVLLALAFGALPACAKKAIAPPPPAAVAGEQSKAEAFLAYEHEVRVDLGDNSVGTHVDAVREACTAERFGACSLLSVQQSAGNYPRGEIVVRIVPSGVEPLVKLASEGGTIGNRATHAEDLADAVADNAHRRELLTNQRARLEGFQARKDLAVADMLALSKELADLDSKYAAKVAEREIALKSEMDQAKATGDEETLQKLRDQLATDKRKLQSELEDKKDRIRQPK